MMKRWKTITLSTTASFSLFAALGSTYAAVNHSAQSGSSFWSQVAANLHVPTATVTNAVKQAEIAQLNRRAASHHLSSQALQKRTASIEKGRLGMPKTHVARHMTMAHRAIHMVAGVLNLKPGQIIKALRQGQTLDQIAQAHNMTSAAFQAQLVAKLELPLQKREQSGKMSAAQLSKREAKITHSVNHMATRPLKGLARGATDHVNLWQNAASQYLGMSRAALRTSLHQGQSLSAIATADSAQGKSVAGLTTAINQALQSKMQKAVASHHLSPSKAQTIESRWSKRVAKLITKKF